MKRCRQALEQGYDNAFVFYIYLQIGELTRVHLDFVDMVYRVVNLFYLTREKLAENEEDVKRTFCLINVAEGFQAFTSPLQLLMCVSWLSAKLGPMMNMSFFKRLWYSFNALGSTLEGGASLESSKIFQKSMDVYNILILNSSKLEVPSIEFVNESSGLVFK